MKQLTIIAVGPTLTATDGRMYFNVDFSAGFGQKKVSRLFWEQYKRDAKTGLPTEAKSWERGSPEQATALMLSGGTVEGEKVTRKVAPYVIGENTVDSYSTLLFPGENIVSVFAAAKHNIIDEETGEILGKQKAILASAKDAVAVPSKDIAF